VEQIISIPFDVSIRLSEIPYASIEQSAADAGAGAASTVRGKVEFTLRVSYPLCEYLICPRRAHDRLAAARFFHRSSMGSP
jgi:hypothetical protein